MPIQNGIKLNAVYMLHEKILKRVSEKWTSTAGKGRKGSMRAATRTGARKSF